MSTTQAIAFRLPPLPYADTALEPVMSARTLRIHHGEHHRAYVDHLNDLVKDDAKLSSMKLEALVQKAASDASMSTIFHNAAQTWNHTFFWNSMKPEGGAQPTGRIAAGLAAAFGDYDGFREVFTDAAKTHFGSGWVWLIEDAGLAVVTTQDAETPMARGKNCLLALDLWEHAYYLDFQQRRMDYVTAYLDDLVNWEFAEKNLG